MKITNINSSVL